MVKTDHNVRKYATLDGVLGGTRQAGGVNVVWAETRRRSPGSRRRVDEARERVRRRDRSDLYRTCSVGRGATPKQSVIT